MKEILLSIQNHIEQHNIYIIVDALEESSKNEMRDVIQMFVRLCSVTNSCIIKVFIASRPLGILNTILDRIETFQHTWIRLQDETRPAIERYSKSFLIGDLKFTDDLLQEATEYVLETAQGVFLWVYLVKAELQLLDENGCTKHDVLEALKSLPKELEGMYGSILDRLSKSEDKRDINDRKIFFWSYLPAVRWNWMSYNMPLLLQVIVETQNLHLRKNSLQIGLSGK
jgi:hypothetical protein